MIKYKTHEDAYSAVEHDGMELQYVDSEIISEELCLKAIKQGEDIDYQKSMDARKKGIGWAIKYVPEKFRTMELCIEAIKRSDYAIGYVPEKVKTDDFWLEALVLNPSILKYIPDIFRTPEVYYEAVKTNGSALRYIPEEFKTPKLCYEAIIRSGYIFKYVPKEFYSTEYSEKAKKYYLKKILKKSPELIKFIPEEYKTADFYLEALKNDGVIFYYGSIPNECKTTEVCIQLSHQLTRALKKNYDFLANHFDFNFLWKIISWKLNAMKNYFTHGAGSRAEKNVQQITEALKHINMLVDDKYEYKNQDPVSGKEIPEELQEELFNKSLNGFVEILKKYSRCWWE